MATQYSTCSSIVGTDNAIDIFNIIWSYKCHPTSSCKRCNIASHKDRIFRSEKEKLVKQDFSRQWGHRSLLIVPLTLWYELLSETRNVLISFRHEIKRPPYKAFQYVVCVCSLTHGIYLHTEWTCVYTYIYIYIRCM